MSNVIGTTLLWVNFGPYHTARLQRLREFIPVDAVEFASAQRLYNWNSVVTRDYVMTLCTGFSETTPKVKLMHRLLRHLNRTKPKVLLIPGYAEVGALAAAAWGRLGGRTNVLMADSTIEDHPRIWWREKLKGWIVRLLFDRALVSGYRAAEYLWHLGFRNRPLAYHYDVVDNDYFAAEAKTLRERAPDGAGTLPSRYFLYVGRLSAEKNLISLLQAFRLYRLRGGHWSLVVVGDGPLGQRLIDEGKDLTNNGTVLFSGYRRYEEIPRYYAFAQALVLPSISEPWGLVVNEAMASGLPVIVSCNCGCVEDLVEEGGNGFVVDPLDEVTLAHTMLRMEQLSEEERGAMGKRSREIIADYSLDAWARDVVHIVSHDPQVLPPASIACSREYSRK